MSLAFLSGKCIIEKKNVESIVGIYRSQPKPKKAKMSRGFLLPLHNRKGLDMLNAIPKFSKNLI